MKLVPIRHKPHLFKNPENGIIYFRQYKKGFGEVKKSTGETVLARAEIKALEFQEAFLKVKPLAIEKRLIEAEWAEWLDMQKRKSKATYESIEIQGRVHLMPFFGGMLPNEITETVWEQYVSHSHKLTPGRKIFNDWKYFSMFLGFLFRARKVSNPPKLVNPDPPIVVGRAFSTDEVERLLQNANDDLALQILMAVTMGMRKSEILLLEWARVDLEKNTIHLRAEDTKIRKARTFGISDIVLSRLKPRSRVLRSPYVFASPTDESRPIGRSGNKTAWTACRRNARVQGRFHDLRHTFLTNAFKTATNPALICHYAGLSLEEADRTYLHFDHEDTRIVSTLFSSPKASPV